MPALARPLALLLILAQVACTSAYQERQRRAELAAGTREPWGCRPLDQFRVNPTTGTGDGFGGVAVAVVATAFFTTACAIGRSPDLFETSHGGSADPATRAVQAAPVGL